MVEVVREHVGLQAQVQASAELQLAARVDGITVDDVRDAIWGTRSLVKARTLRGTLHLHPAGELSSWYAARRVLAAAAPPDPAIVGEWRDPEGAIHPPLREDQIVEIEAAVMAALDGRCLTREEIADEVVAAVGPDPRQRLLSGFGFFLGDLCAGPPRGTKVTFVRPDQWLDGWHEPDGHKAVVDAARRFLRTYGPARPADFREWFMPRLLDVAAARAIFDSLGDEVEEIDVEGSRYFVLAGDDDFAEPTSSVRLLPEYDAYVLGFRDRDRLVPGPVREQVGSSARGRFEGATGARLLLVDGLAAGVWQRHKRGKRLELDVTPAGRLTRTQRAELASEAERIGVFLGLEPALRLV
jgi:winged helix DNA-binding protein